MKHVLLCLLLAACQFATAQSVDSVQLNDVIVTGQYKPQSLKNSVYQVRTINAATIQQRGATSVLGILDNELGVRFANDNTLGETDVELMGMSGANVKVLLDGIPLVDRGSNRQSLTQIDVNSIERIEIVEGPMSVVYGTDGLGGVINIITKKNHAKDQLSVSARVQEETVGSEYKPFYNDGQHTESIYVSYAHHGFFAGAGFTRNDFGGWSDTLTGRRKAWHPKNQLLPSVNVGYAGKTWKAWYRLDYLDEDIISKGDVNMQTGKATDQHYLTDRYTHQAQAEWQMNQQLSLDGALSYQHYQRRTRTTIKDLTDGKEVLSTDAGTQDTSKFSTLFFRSTLQYAVSSDVTIQPGVEYQHDQASGQRITGTPEITNYAAFVSAEMKILPWLTIRPGVRFSKNSIYDAPPVIPSVNTKMALSDRLDLRLSYARGFRAPALEELYFHFFDASHAIEGNPDLKAENSNSYTGSVTWQAWQSAPGIQRTKRIQSADNLSITATGFYNDFHNRIDLALEANSSGVYTYFNISRFKTTGGTISGTLHKHALEATIGFSYIGRYNDLTGEKDGGAELLWTPEVNSNITYHFQRIGATLNLFYKFNGRRQTYETITPATGEPYQHLAIMDSWHNADVTATKKLTKLVSLNAGVRNLLNVKNINNSTLNGAEAHSAGTALPMQYGRSYFIGLNFNWNKP
jgi:outer membrane receptor for ferrienterochelin and colicins